MDTPESLQTIAEISVAFAGFSGLIVALRRNAGPLTKVQKYRLQVLLSLAFGAMFLSFVPELLFYFSASPGKIWVLSSVILSIYSVLFLIWWLTASLRIKTTNPEIFNWFALSRMAAGHVVVVLLQLGVVFSLLEQSSAGAYSAALIWYLIHAAQQFTRMLFVQPKGTLQQNE
jgi:hypothetical protein